MVLPLPAYRAVEVVVRVREEHPNACANVRHACTAPSRLFALALALPLCLPLALGRSRAIVVSAFGGFVFPRGHGEASHGTDKERFGNTPFTIKSRTFHPPKQSEIPIDKHPWIIQYVQQRVQSWIFLDLGANLFAMSNKKIQFNAYARHLVSDEKEYFTVLGSMVIVLIVFAGKSRRLFEAYKRERFDLWAETTSHKTQSLARETMPTCERTNVFTLQVTINSSNVYGPVRHVVVKLHVLLYLALLVVFLVSILEPEK